MRKLRLLVGRFGSSWTNFEERFPWNFAFSPATRGWFNAFLQNGEDGIGRMLCVRHVSGIETLDDGYCSNYSKGVNSRLTGLRYHSIPSSTNTVRDRREEAAGSRISTWNLISCNAAISRFAQQGRHREAFSLFFRMQDEHLRPNRITFLSLLKAFAGPNDLEGGKRVHDLIFKQRLESDVRVGTALICMYFRCGSPQDAHRVFTGIRNRDLIVWNALIEGYCLAGLRERALETFRVMRIEGIQPDMATFLSILKSCNEPSHLDEGQRLHKVIIESGLELSVRIQTAIVRMYNKCGSLVDARRVFDKLPRKDVGLWTTMIAGYAQAGHGEEAFERFEAMRKAGMHPNKMTFLALLKACTRPECLQKGKWLHDQIKLAGYDRDEKVGTALIKVYSKCRSLEDARKVFDNHPRKNVISWTALISGYVLNGRAEEALDLYEQMQREGVQPNEITKNTVVDACSRLGAV